MASLSLKIREWWPYLIQRGPYLVLCLVLAVPFIPFLWPGKRSFVVSVRTYSAEIEFFGSRTKLWHLPLKAEIYCDLPETVCPNINQNNQIIEWHDGTVVNLRKTNDGGIEFLVVGPTAESAEVSASNQTKLRPSTLGDTPLALGTRIVIPPDSWREDSNFIFTGYTRIGSEVSTGTRDHLLSGHYEVYEKFLLRDLPSRILQGEFIAGDEVAFYTENSAEEPRTRKRIPATGFLSAAPRNEDDARWFDLVAYTSSTEGAYMEISRLGTDISRIRPNWADRAINDGWALGWAALLAMLGAVVQIVTGVKDLLGR